MTDYRLPIQQAPPRKPVSGMHRGYPFEAYEPHQQQQAYLRRPQHPQQPQLSPHPSVSSAHSRNQTSSSQVLPYAAHQQQYAAAPSPHYTMTGHVSHPSRRLSSATTSTSSTGNNFSSDIHRSTSGRSTNAQVGYVALMRRQKATVWCDRAQPEDPRLRAQKLADKKRAYLEVHGAGAGRTGTLGSGKNKLGNKGATEFSASTLVGATVPVRLSANEVGDADEDGSETGFPHRRTGSGRSSLGSNYRYPSGYQRSPQGTPGSNNTPPNERADLPEVTENPPAERHEEEKVSSAKDDSATSHSKTSEQEDSFGSVGDMAAPSAATTAAEKARKADELRRRGSVDERTTTMTNVRLFVANPDADLSD
ncbi:hypothetical protein CNMCM5793_001396 [Aspergillus hiratsukae]|uniref:Uncharacterized protein n=1 Tax=Aspergillus hiratsukae TaxID=1194566 RepID=A0A8H6UA42_9EURO|nr:hypothetical protein CNMCM5793_001396 [Aspergillus hiratsukae]KAF7167125.1 hypothetical protein CNMCM6106_002810 [Aspergillus hiratsukae]